MNPEKRSRLMSRVRGRDTKPELTVRRYLHAHGLRYRLHDRKLVGRPDLVFHSRRVVVFVHGCFWHGHDKCPYYKLPATRVDFWAAKIAENRARDAKTVDALIVTGWRVAVVWACALRGDVANVALPRLERFIRSDEASCEIRAPRPAATPTSRQEFRKRSSSAS